MAEEGGEPAAASSTASAAVSAVVCHGLGKSFGEDEVVCGLNLTIPEGTIVGLIGPSGCGKTTTVRLLTGVYAPTSGTAHVYGTPAVDLSVRQRQRIGYLPQIPALFPQLSLWENLSFHASMYGLRLRRRAWLHQLLEWVELDEHRDKKVREVSGGMQRRLALAASLVHDPQLVFLDEPTAGIDPILRAKFWERFREMRDQGRTICLTTQYVGEAAYCDTVGLLSEGRLLLLDTPDNLRRAAFNGEVVEVEVAERVDPLALAPLTQVDGVLAPPEEIEPRRWRVVVDDADRRLIPVREALVQMGVPVIETAEHIVDHDEAFVRVVERHRRGPVDEDPAPWGPPSVTAAVR